MSVPLRLAVIADDLTGAADTGVQFCPALGPVALLEALPPSGDCLPAGLAISTNSRHLEPDRAARAVRTAAAQVSIFSPERIYKKIDSCLRGNLGAEIEALLAAAGKPAAFIAPAYPEQGRTTVGGIHLIDNRPVAETEIGRDPRGPVATSDLARLLAGQCRLSLGTIGLDLLEGADAPLIDRIRDHLDNERRLIVFDARQRRHLDRIAALVVDHFPAAVPVGSAGLAGSLAALMAPGQPPGPSVRRPIARWLFICGSASTVLAGQVARLQMATGWPHLCLAAADLAAARTAGAVQRGQALFEKGGQQGLIVSLEEIEGGGPTADPGQVVDGLAVVAAELTDRVGPDGLFLCGGDTAEALRRRLRASGLLLYEEALPGLVRGEFIGGACAGLTVVTKAGGFGDEETLSRLVTLYAP